MLTLGACAMPAQRMDAAASSAGFGRRIVEGSGFRHVVYENGRVAAGRRLHVYIEGDGSPYLDRRTVSLDPTPRRPLMLDLMSLDEAPAAYVGRPCYGGLASDPPCTPLDWTLGRFSPRVVESMAGAIAALVEQSSASGVDLFGHSGGGTIAVLLAMRLPNVRRVVTLAGNLDTDAWADLHGYARLSGSLNPVHAGPLPAQVGQEHYAGGRDRIVPPALVEGAATRLGSGVVFVVPDLSHQTGWEAHWPVIVTGQWPLRSATDQRKE
jgi:pimeloyl-ACP methyl ester carboxylesterase